MRTHAVFSFGETAVPPTVTAQKEPCPPCPISGAKLRDGARNTVPRLRRRSLQLEILEDRTNPSLGFGFAVGGDTVTGNNEVTSITTTTDADGNAYTTGAFSGTVHFRSVALTSTGAFDAFVAKYSPAGSLDWVADLGGTGSGSESQGNGIAVDSFGNVFTTGFFKGTVNFDPRSGSHQLTSSDNGATSTAYVSALTSSGAWKDDLELGYATGNVASVGATITIDNSYNVCTAGYFQGAGANFDPHSANHQLTSSNNGANTTSFVSKLDPSDNYVFGVPVADGGASANSYATDIAADSLGNVYTVGRFFGTNVNFDPSGNGHQLTSSDNGINQTGYMSVLTPLGGWDDGLEFGYALGNVASEATNITIDGSFNVITTGFFQGANVDFDPNSTSRQLTSSNNGANNTAFVLKLNSSDNYVFAVPIGAGGADSQSYGYGIVVDNAGNVYTEGSFIGSDVNFDPNGAGNQLTSTNNGAISSVYVSKLTPSGADAFGVELADGGNGASVDFAGLVVDTWANIYVTGVFSGADVNLNPVGAYDLSTGGNNVSSYFLVQLTQNPLQILTMSLSNGQVGSSYAAQIVGAGGRGVDSFQLTSGALPGGMTLGAAGQITGTPTSPGAFAFTVTITDAAGDTDSQSYMLTIVYGSVYAPLAFAYSYNAYIYAYDAYVAGEGSYTTFVYSYVAYYYAQAAYTHELAGDAAASEYYAYYAYYYGYFEQSYAYQDYARSGGSSIYSYFAYYDGHYGYNYSYEMAIGF